MSILEDIDDLFYEYNFHELLASYVNSIPINRENISQLLQALVKYPTLEICNKLLNDCQKIMYESEVELVEEKYDEILNTDEPSQIDEKGDYKFIENDDYCDNKYDYKFDYDEKDDDDLEKNCNSKNNDDKKTNFNLKLNSNFESINFDKLALFDALDILDF